MPTWNVACVIQWLMCWESSLLSSIAVGVEPNWGLLLVWKEKNCCRLVMLCSSGRSTALAGGAEHRFTGQ
jgi:hypothetical protein